MRSASAIAVLVACATAAYFLAPRPGPFTTEAKKLNEELVRLEFDDQYRPCLGFNVVFGVNNYRSVEWVAETEAGPFRDEQLLRAALDDLRSYIERRRTYVEACKAGMAAGQWTGQTKSKALQDYAEKKRAAEEAWKRARSGS